MTEVNIFIAFTAGIFSFLSPCVLPLIPSYLSFVSGVSLEEMRAPQVESRVRWRVALNSLAFIFGFSLVFVSLGVSASFLGSLFLGYRNLIRVLGGIFIVLVGIYLMGFFKISLLDRYLQFHLKDKPAGYLGSSCGDHLCSRLDSLRGTDSGGDSHFGRDLSRDRKGSVPPHRLCRRTRCSLLSQRCGCKLFFSIFADLSSLYSGGARRGRHPISDCRNPSHNRLYDPPEYLRHPLDPPMVD